MNNSYRYRSFFWPGILILAGAIALLVNTGQISVERLGLLASLWPLILIVIGLELIVRRTMHGPSGDLVAALIVIVALVSSVVYVATSPNASARTYDTVGATGSFQAANVDIAVGAATVEISGVPDMTELFRAHFEYTGQQPSVTFDQSTHTLRVEQNDTRFNFFQSREFEVTLQLNTDVRWAIREDSGAASITNNLARLDISSLQLNTGASKDDITLGSPSGTVPIEVDGGALTVQVHRPAGVNASVEVSGGAITLDADGHSSHAFGQVTYGSVPGDSDGYRIKINGGACTVTLDTSAPSA